MRYSGADLPFWEDSCPAAHNGPDHPAEGQQRPTRAGFSDHILYHNGDRHRCRSVCESKVHWVYTK